MWKAGDRHKERPWALWATISLAPMVRKNEWLRIACESVSGPLLGVPPPLTHRLQPRRPVLASEVRDLSEYPTYQQLTQ